MMTVLRFLQIATRVVQHGPGLLYAAVSARRTVDRDVALGGVGTRLADLLESLGPIWIKLGQSLAGRSDLADPALLAPLSRLQDRVRPTRWGEIARTLEHAYGGRRAALFSHIDPVPVAVGSIAQVHRAVLAGDGRHIVLKVKRPGVDRLLEADLRIVAMMTGVVARLPGFRDVPIREVMNEIMDAVRRQTDFRAEAANARRFADDYQGQTGVVFARPVAELCTDDVVVLDYVPGLRRIDDPAVGISARRLLVKKLVDVLYRMIFRTGFIHCDMHLGNAMAARTETLALLDYGLVADMSGEPKADFREFFRAFAFNDPRACTDIMLKTAKRVAADIDVERFNRDVAALVAEATGKKANGFRITPFVRRLFEIQRDHGVMGNSDFTMAILSLINVEGIVMRFNPDLDFQALAVPHFMAAMSDRLASGER